jgi:GTP-binding protein HflX
VPELLARVETVLNRSMTPIEALIPYSAGELVNLWHVHGLIEQEEHTEQGVRVRGLLPEELAGRMQMYATSRAVRHGKITADEEQRMSEGDVE